MWKASGDRYSYAGTLSQLGRTVSRAGRHEEALEIFAEARAGLEDVGAHADVLETDAKVAECYLFMGRTEDALALAERTLSAVNAPDSVSVAGPLLRTDRGLREDAVGRPRRRGRGVRIEPRHGPGARC